MPPNPLAQAVKSTKRNDRWLLGAYGKYLGTAQHPRGELLSVYRKYRRMLWDILNAQRPTMAQEISILMLDARREIEGVIRRVLTLASQRGRHNAQEQAQFYLNDGLDFQVAGELADTAAAQTAWINAFDSQVLAIQAHVAAGIATVETIIGDQDRMGLFQPAPMQREGSRWIPQIMWIAWTAWIIGLLWPREQQFQKQVIAATDSRTTECCLNANGQIVRFRGKFRLTGTPRFARRMDWTPFHWYCRSSVVLYKPEYDDGITERQKALSAVEWKRRREEAEKKR